MAKLTFKQDAELEFVESYDEETDKTETSDETFKAGDVLETDILSETATTISVQAADGSCCYGLPKILSKSSEKIQMIRLG